MNPHFSIQDEFPPVSYDQWRAIVDESLKGASFEDELITDSYEGIDVRPIYSGRDEIDESDSIGVWKQAKKGSLEAAFDRLDNCSADSTLVRLAKRCLQVDPAKRPIDASEVAFEMASFRESALEQVECDMTRFFELSLDLFCIAGFDGFFRRINSNFSRVLGFSDHELLSRPFLDFVFKEDRLKTIDVMGELLKGQPVVRFCNRYLTISGETIMFEWTAKSIPEENVIFAVARQLD